MTEYRPAKIPDNIWERDFSKKPKIIRYQLMDKSHGVDGYETPPEGGILQWWVGWKYPVKGLFISEDVQKSEIVKRLALEQLRLLATPPFVYIVGFLLILPLPNFVYRKLFFKIVDSFRQVCDKTFRDRYLAPDKYCKSGREIYRAISVVAERKNDWIKGIMIQSSRGICMTWNNDTAYRYRGQDLFGNIDREALKKNPRKEILRLFDLLIERERDFQLTSEIWTKIRTLLSIFLLIRKGVLKDYIEVLEEIDPQKIELDEGDYYHCLHRPGFNFRGVPFEERKKIREFIDKEK